MMQLALAFKHFLDFHAGLVSWLMHCVRAWSFPWLALGLALSLAIMLGGWRHWVRLARSWPRTVWFEALGLGGLSLLLAWLVVPHCPQVYFDEINIIELGRNMYARGYYDAYSPITGLVRILPIPPGESFFVALGFYAGGVNYYITVLEGLFWSGGSVVALYLCVWMLCKRRVAAFCAAWGLALLPVHLRMSCSCALENGSLFWLSLACLGLACWRWEMREDERSTPDWWLWFTGLALGWFIDWRMENSVILCPLLLLVLNLADPVFRTLWRRPQFYGALLLALILGWPGIYCDMAGIGSDFYLFYRPAADLAKDVAAHSQSNWLYWVRNMAHPLALSLWALAGLLVARRHRAAWLSLLWFVLLNFFYARIPSADFAMVHSLDSWRNALNPALGLVLLAALGADCLYEMLGATRGTRWKMAVPVLFVLMSLYGLVSQLPFIERLPSSGVYFVGARELTGRLPLQQEGRLLLDCSSVAFKGNTEPAIMCFYATDRPWYPFALDVDGRLAPDQELCPQILRDLVTWTKEGPVYLMHLGKTGEQADIVTEMWFNEYVKMDLLGSWEDEDWGNYCAIYSLSGLQDAGLQWVERDFHVRFLPDGGEVPLDDQP